MDKDEREVNQAPETAGAPGEQKAAGKKKGFVKRLGTLLLILAVVLTVAVLSTMEDGRHFAALRRWLMYGESGATEDMYVYSADPNNRFGQMKEGLLVVTPKSIRLHRDDGTTLYDLPIALDAPALSVGREQAVVCGVGSGTLYRLDGAGILETLTLDHERCFYTARLNERDWLAVTEEKSGYKTAVSVYDDGGELVFSFDSHESYISDALVTDDCRYLVAVSLQPEGGVFGSRLLVFDLEKAERISDAPIRDGLVLDLAVTNGRVAALCDKRLTLSTLEGEPLLDHAYGSLYLHDYALTGGDFCALLLGRYQAGNICTLTTFDLEGQTIATLEVTEEVLDMSANGKYLAVLYSDSLVIYTRDLQEHARLEGTDYASQVHLGEDGVALVIGGTTAWRFLP